MLVRELFEDEQMYIVYRAYGTQSRDSYYGYARGDSLEAARKTFLGGGNREADPDRADVKFMQSNGGNPDNVKFEMIDVTSTEEEAWLARNDIRQSAGDSVTGPTNFPIHVRARAEAEHPERFGNMMQQRKLMMAKTAREAYAIANEGPNPGPWGFANVKAIAAASPKNQVKNDLEKMTPSQFASVYFK